jgi:hypothetical protein
MFEDFAQNDQFKSVFQRPPGEIVAPHIESQVPEPGHLGFQHVDPDATRRHLPQTSVQPLGIVGISQGVVHDADVEDSLARSEGAEVMGSIPDEASRGGGCDAAAPKLEGRRVGGIR